MDKLDEDKASFDCNQVSKVFPLRMEETLAESSQDMKPEQSWISEKLETVTVIEINTNNTFPFMLIFQVVVYLEEHRQSIFYLVLF